MKKFILTILLGMVLSTIFAGEFMTDANKAFAKAKKEDKLVLAIFSGSDWCPPCKRFEKNVTSKKEFFKELEKQYVFLFVDFPRYKKLDKALATQNNQLQKKYGVNSFPTLMILSADGAKILKTNIGMSDDVDTFVTWFGGVSQAALAKYKASKKIRIFL